MLCRIAYIFMYATRRNNLTFYTFIWHEHWRSEWWSEQRVEQQPPCDVRRTHDGSVTVGGRQDIIIMSVWNRSSHIPVPALDPWASCTQHFSGCLLSWATFIDTSRCGEPFLLPISRCSTTLEAMEVASSFPFYGLWRLKVCLKMCLQRALCFLWDHGHSRIM